MPRTAYRFARGEEVTSSSGQQGIGRNSFQGQYTVTQGYALRVLHEQEFDQLLVHGLIVRRDYFRGLILRHGYIRDLIA